MTWTNILTNIRWFWNIIDIRTSLYVIAKKAFISIVNEDVISLARNANKCGYYTLRKYFKRRKLDMHMGYCRKMVGTYLRMKGIETETIDLLQGRVPKSIFARHYFRPDFDKQCKKIRLELTSLHRMIGIS
jgi:intergrase/recombinase